MISGERQNCWSPRKKNRSVLNKTKLHKEHGGNRHSSACVWPGLTVPALNQLDHVDSHRDRTTLMWYTLSSSGVLRRPKTTAEKKTVANIQKYISIRRQKSCKSYTEPSSARGSRNRTDQVIVPFLYTNHRSIRVCMCIILPMRSHFPIKVFDPPPEEKKKHCMHSEQPFQPGEFFRWSTFFRQHHNSLDRFSQKLPNKIIQLGRANLIHWHHWLLIAHFDLFTRSSHSHRKSL